MKSGPVTGWDPPVILERGEMDYSFDVIAPQRFGYGRKPGEAPPQDRQSLLDQVPAGAAGKVGFVADDSRSRIRRLRDFTLRLREARKAKDSDRILAIRRERVSFMRNSYAPEAHERVLWSVLQPDGFYERLAFFWTDHFTVSVTKASLRPLVSTYEAEAIRPFIAGDFRALLRSAVLHPVMQLYLDQNRSVGPGSPVGLRSKRGLNENLGREVIELHTLGVAGAYSQDDVRQFATLLTGVTVEEDEGVEAFDPDLSEPGSVTVLGRRYGGDPTGLAAVLQALDDLARHPSTARHLAWKLAVHFLADDPPEEVVQHLAATYLDNDTALLPVYRALLEHPASWETYGRKVRQPFDYVVAALRVALPPGREREAAEPRRKAFETMDGAMSSDPLPVHYPLTLFPLNAMGQLPWSAPGPNGWPEAADAWVSPQGLTERIDFADRLARGPLRKTPPQQLFDAAFGPLSPDRLALLMQETKEAQEATVLVLASPEFQRR